MRRKTIFTALIIFVLAALFITSVKNRNKGILGFTFCNGISPCEAPAEPAITVNGFIRINEVLLKYYPEKRIPVTLNWDTIATVAMQNCTTSTTYTFPGIVSDSNGDATINVPIATSIPDGNYRFFVRGASHLNKEFSCYPIMPDTGLTDLTPEGDLLAGEISIVYDNYINSLDISVLANELFSADYYSDLNQDSEVNGLDLSNQIYNIFTA